MGAGDPECAVLRLGVALNAPPLAGEIGDRIVDGLADVGRGLDQALDEVVGQKLRRRLVGVGHELVDLRYEITRLCVADLEFFLDPDRGPRARIVRVLHCAEGPPGRERAESTTGAIDP